MTNPGSLTTGFAGVHPRQLAPSVGTTQVGITISTVPSPASHNSRASSTTTSRSTSRSPRNQENFRAHHSKIDINKSAHAQPTGQKNVCVAGTRDGDSKLISTIPSVERCEFQFSKICEKFQQISTAGSPSATP